MHPWTDFIKCGTNVPLVDVINFDKFSDNLFKDSDFTAHPVIPRLRSIASLVQWSSATRPQSERLPVDRISSLTRFSGSAKFLMYLRKFPLEFCNGDVAQKTRLMPLPDGGKSLTIIICISLDTVSK